MSDNVKQMPTYHTDVDDFISELDGGIFKQKLGMALSDASAGTMDFKKNGKVIITIDMQKLGDTDMLEIKSCLDFKIPTLKGFRSENTSEKTPFYVGIGGKLAIFPHEQKSLFDDKNKDKA